MLNNTWRTSIHSLILFCLFTLAMSARLVAQIDTGRILGTVNDSSGAVVPNARVSLVNEDTGLKLTQITDTGGSYMFTALKVGAYRVEVEGNGFSKFVRSGISLQLQEEVLVNATLTPGQVTQTVEVNETPSLLQTQNASLGQTIETRKMNELPLNGRNWLQLALLSAGVTSPRGNGADAGGFSASGLTIVQNDFRLNGIDNNNEMYAYGGAASILPPPDAMQEFKIQTGNYGAEFGHSAGGIVNGVIKSGTNQFHGDAWEYVRNDLFDAPQFFENASGGKKGPYRQNQFGVALGGPVIIPHVYNGRGKTFFFADYQGTRIRQSGPGYATVPTALMRSTGYTNLQDLITFQGGTRTDNLGRTFPLGAVFDPASTRTVTAGQVDPVTGITANTTGLVRDPFYQGNLAGLMDFTSPTAKSLLNILPANRLDSNALKLLNIYPQPNLPGLYNNYYAEPSNKNDVDQFDVRLDHNFSAKDQMFGVIGYSHNPAVTKGLIPTYGGTGGPGITLLTRQSYTLSETHIFSPTLINEIRLGYNRNLGNTESVDANTMGIPEEFGIKGIPQVPGNGGLPAINVSGLSSLGAIPWSPTLSLTQTIEMSDNLTKIYGGHAFKGGVQIDHIRGVATQPLASHGSFSFGGGYTGIPNIGGGGTGIAQLLLTPVPATVPNGFDFVGGADGISASNFASTDDVRNYYGVYFQDDWRATKKLTLNLGLRWDYFEPYREIYGAQANFIPGPPGNGAAFLLPESRCNNATTPLSPSFLTLLQKDGIALRCVSDGTLGNAQKTNFAPRFGFAYQLKPNLVLRGGYGIFYGALDNTGYGFNLGNNYPFLYNFYFPPADAAHPIVFSNGSIGTLENGFLGVPLTPAAVNAQGLSFSLREFNFDTPYTQDVNFAVQYAITQNLSLQIAYVGALSRHGDTTIPINSPNKILPPGTNPQPYVPFPDFGQGWAEFATEGNSHYHSLQVTLERRFSGGLDFLANYTYSKALSDYIGFDRAINYRAPTLPGFGIKGDYALYGNDVPHMVHFSGLYQLPFGAGRRWMRKSHGVLNQIVGGWQTNWILTLQSGQPFSIGCPIGTSSDFGCNALLVPGQDIYAGPHNVNQWLNPQAFAQPPAATAIGQTDFSPLGGGSTQARGPGLHQLDGSLIKEFPISEKKRLEFRAEFFNLTNTPNFGFPSFLDFTNPVNFSRITYTVNSARQIQFALKFHW